MVEIDDVIGIKTMTNLAGDGNCSEELPFRQLVQQSELSAKLARLSYCCPQQLRASCQHDGARMRPEVNAEPLAGYPVWG